MNDMIYFEGDVIYDRANIDQAIERLEQILMNDFFNWVEKVEEFEEVDWMKEGF